MKKIAPNISSEQIIISTAKGLEEETHLRNSEIIKKFCSARIAVLSGPTHSEEVIKGLPTAAVIASGDKEVAENIQELFMSSSFRFYTNSDVVGVELGGAVKNIIAVATGIGDGLGYGDNSRAALLTRGLTEMSRLGIYLGGKSLTFSGLAGMGDLVVTCNSMHSRNRRFGINIGKGMSVKEALAGVEQVVEGVKTTRSIYSWICEGDIEIELPITSQVYQVLFKNKDPLAAVNDLMLRGPKHELEKVVDEKGW
jgi:glycerol-3-phosphate dehydrogenase (NAD(P)+)